MKLLIVIPAYNEAESIKRVVDNLCLNYPQFDYVIVNDGSRDETALVCRQNNYNLLDLPVNLGLDGAFNAGVKYAYRNNYDCVLQFDGDGQHDPQYIQPMLDVLMEQKVSIVIGSRFKNDKRRFNLRAVGNTLISFSMLVTTGKRVTDPTSGMRMYDRSMIKEFSSNINYAPEPDTISYLIKNGVTFKEIPVQMFERLNGESYLNLTSAAKYMLYMSVSIFFIQFFRKRTK